MEGIIAINKPKGPTSHDIIDHLRKVTGVKRVGHAGTLDPLASGVLVVGIGREATKRLGEIVKEGKEYMATIKFGEESSTDDEEGQKTSINFKTIPRRADVDESVKKFVGKIQQTPPLFSAVKIGGREAYKFARRNQSPTLLPRTVQVEKIEILRYDFPILELKIKCASGVYVRSIARDLGRNLGCGGYLADLKRTRVGSYKLNDSLSLEQFSSLWNKSKKETVEN